MSALDDVAALNEDILALERAGVRLDLGLGNSFAACRRGLEQAMHAIAVPMARGASAAEAVANPRTPLPGAYRSLLAVGLRLGSFAEPLDALRRRAVARSEMRGIVRRALVYPFLVAGLAVAGIMVNARTLAPPEEAIYEQFDLAPGPRFERLAMINDTRWPAATAMALGAALVVAAQRSGWLRRLRPRGLAQHEATIEQGHLARQLALLTARDVPWEESLGLVQGLAADAGLGETFGPSAPRLRPLFRWALAEDLASPDRATALAAVDAAYEDRTVRQAGRLRVLLPALTCAVVGGAAVLLHGWVVFGPWGEMLLKLSNPQ
ncbi:MAG: hypothetical protein KF688_13270 [Pirellulales bacterium]|nr:hypothetical protein [Pirellulales bacterium]